MAFPRFFSLIFIAVLTVCSSEFRCSDAESHRIVSVKTLLPSGVCSSEDEHDKLLKVVDRHGPCARHNRRGHSPKPTHLEALNLDESRAESLRQRWRSTLPGTQRPSPWRSRGPAATTIPARSGHTLGTGNYVVTVGFGTPKKDLSVIFDTGSDLTWIQCQPCVRSCYQQQEPIFDPRQSSTYKNISCSSAECSNLQSATGNKPGCSDSSCIYGIRYGDGSFSIGFYAKETLTLKDTYVLPGMEIGCGENNQGLFGQAAGLLGLGRGEVSLVSQSAEKYGKVFSYCLPSNPSTNGYLILGRTAQQSSIKYTPLLTYATAPSFYFLEIIGISVGGQKLSIPASVFQTAGTLIDTGTVISRFPPAAYAALRSAFREQMSKYPTAPALSILDTCYNFTGFDTVSIPKVAIVFRGNVSLDIQLSGILYLAKISQACLAFAGNNDPSDLAILGNSQQKTYQVVYDVAKGAIGFGGGGCS